MSLGSRHGLTVVAALLVGVLVAAQSRINGELADRVGSGVVAASISFGLGLVLITVIVVSRANYRQAMASLPATLRRGGLRPWHLLGGLAGAWLVTTQGLVVTVVGVTTFTIGVVAGQVTGSLVVDRIGLSPAGRMPVTANRAIAAGVALLAVALVALRGGRFDLSWVVLLAVSAGLGSAVQQAINGRVASAVDQPLAATLVNFIVGTSALLLVSGLLLTVGTVTFEGWPGQWWLYLGGPIGVVFIALSAWAVHGVGVLVFALLSIAGQLVGSVIIDLVAPAHTTPLGWMVWLGVALIAVAVALATSPGRDRIARKVLVRRG